MLSTRRYFLFGALAAPVLAQKKKAAAPERPNILLIVSDQERARGWLPPGLDLPNRRRLIDEGIEFTLKPQRDRNGRLIARFTDDDGNEFEVLDSPKK